MSVAASFTLPVINLFVINPFNITALKAGTICSHALASLFFITHPHNQQTVTSSTKLISAPLHWPSAPTGSI